MAIKRPKPEDIFVKLRQFHVLIGQSMPRNMEVVRSGYFEPCFANISKILGTLPLPKPTSIPACMLAELPTAISELVPRSSGI